MAALLSCPYSAASPASSSSTKFFSRHRPPFPISHNHLATRRSSPLPIQCQIHNQQKRKSFSIKECAISIALAVGLVTGVPALDWCSNAYAAANPVVPDLAVLISGPPIKDPGALLRYSLPIDNKAIREVQKPLEDITESLKVAGVKALDSAERNLRQASRALTQGKSLVVSGLAESKKEHGVELLAKLEAGMKELQQIVEDRNRDEVAAKQKELLQYVGG